MKYLEQLHAELTKRSDELAAMVTREMGAPNALARGVQTGLALVDVATAAAALPEGTGKTDRELPGYPGTGRRRGRHYPVELSPAPSDRQGRLRPGGPGCTVVLKPSEITPFSAYLLIDAAQEIGLPDGVINLVTGYGPTAGEAIAAHPGVDMVSFTGSTRAGTRVAELASATVKKVALELGGKSANVILPDADLGRAVKVGVANCFLKRRPDLHGMDPDDSPCPAVRAGRRPGCHRGGEVHDW